jgi:hypothetical protein
VTCEQGGDTPDSIAYHYMWNPHTLVGTITITNQVAVCNNPKGYETTNKLVLVPA